MYTRPYRERSPGQSYRPPDSRAYHPGSQMSPSSATATRSIELPRPSEPAPASHSWPSSAGPGDINRKPGVLLLTSYLAETRHTTAQLPGVRDILSPGHHTTVASAYPSGWQTAGPPAIRPDYRSSASEIYYGSQQQPQQHPPAPFVQPYPIGQQTYKPLQGRNLQLAVLNTKPESGPAPHFLPAVSRNGYSENSKDFSDAHLSVQRQASINRNSVEGPRTPYTPTGPDMQERGNSGPPYGPLSGGASISGQSSVTHYLGVREIHGKGACHVWDNGQTTPEYIDGDWVNPHWGVTKANKPRKRLAQACLDCREKKIKCEPGELSCVQCEKAKRPCRRASGPQTPGEIVPSAPWTTTSPIRNRFSDPTLTGNREATVVDPARKRRRSPDLYGSPGLTGSRGDTYARPKKVRSASPMVNLGLGSRLAPPDRVNQGEPSTKCGQSGSASEVFSWEEDPYSVDPETTLHLLQLYFVHVNSTTYRMFPVRAFVVWVERSPRKCQNELMLLYAVLAMGSVFADPSLSSVAKRCADIATFAIERKHGRFSLQLAQSRLVLSLYNFAKGRNDAAWDHCGGAIRAVSALHFNSEERCSEGSDPGPGVIRDFAFSQEQMIECRRRTFWSAFLMDRYNGFVGGMNCGINPEDVFLRLPCPDSAFDAGTKSTAPYFNNETIDPDLSVQTHTSEVAPMAWLIMISAIWGEVLTFVQRSTYHRSLTSYPEAYETFYDTVYTRINAWLSTLPPGLKHSIANMDRSIQEGYAGTYVSMHALYHFTLMKLNRCLRHGLMPEAIVRRNIRAANNHAHELLRLINTLRNARQEVSNVLQGQNSVFAFSAPFPGFVALQAIDIVGAGGLNSELDPTLREIDDGIACLKQLSGSWMSSRAQLIAAEKRRSQILEILENPISARAGCQLGRNWGLEAPMDREFRLDADSVYGVDQRVYFDALA